jgi:hypothetical protein
MLNQETVSTKPRSGDSGISHSRLSVGFALLLSGTVLVRGVQAQTPVEWACPDYPNLLLNRSFEGKAHRRHDNPAQWHVGGGAVWSREAARSGDAAVRFSGPGWAGQRIQLLPETEYEAPALIRQFKGKVVLLVRAHGGKSSAQGSGHHSPLKLRFA